MKNFDIFFVISCLLALTGCSKEPEKAAIPIGYVKITNDLRIPNNLPRFTPKPSAIGSIDNTVEQASESSDTDSPSDQRLPKLIQGQVTDHENKSIADAKIQCNVSYHYVSDSISGDGSHSFSTETDQEGRYQIDLPQNRYHQQDDRTDDEITLKVFAPGKVGQIRKPGLPVKESALTVDFMLQPGNLIRLRFVDQNDKPVPGIWIRNNRLPDLFYDEKENSDAEGRWQTNASPPEGETFVFRSPTQKEGRGFSRKYFSYQFEESNRKESLLHEKLILPQEDEQTIKLIRYEIPRDDFRFRETGWDLPETMTLYVKDSNGQPMTEATVIVDYQEGISLGFFGGADKFRSLAKTDESGKLCIDFQDRDPEKCKRLEITISKPGYASMKHQWEYDDFKAFSNHRGGEIPELATVTLPEGQWRQGQIIDRNDKPLDGINVECFYKSAYPEYYDRDSGTFEPVWNKTATTDADGNWTLGPIPNDAEIVRTAFRSNRYQGKKIKIIMIVDSGQ